MIPKPKTAARATRRSPSVATPTRPAPPPAPDRIAFIGTAQTVAKGGEPVFVQVLCWPIVPVAWASLSQSFEAVRLGRSEPAAIAAASALPPSWVRACAPQIGEPFRDTQAEESSVAALVLRTHIQISVAIVDARQTHATAASVIGGAQLQALSTCLNFYDKSLRVQKRRACEWLIVRGQDADGERRSQEEFALCRSRLSQAEVFRDMQLRFWKQGVVEPLPLELAQVIAASVLRRQMDEDAANPVFDAIATKLVHDPFPYKKIRKQSRR